MYLKKVNNKEIFLKGTLGFLFLLNSVFFIVSITSCAKEIKGAGSGAMPPSVASIPINIIFASGYEFAEKDKSSLFGIGAWNLKPSLMVGYVMDDSILGFGVSGILFSGLKIEYGTGVGDVSYMKIGMKGKSSFLAFGGGVGAVYSEDYNFSERARKHKFVGGHFYGLAHFYTQAEGSSIGFYINLRPGYYHYFSTFLKKVAEEMREKEIKEDGSPTIKVKDNFGGLFFSPAFGMVARAINGRVGLIFDLNLPLSAALIFEPDLHPYVPSFNFALVF